MIISHNLLAMNAQRQFNISTDKKKKTTEKLSSGYKINRAADDAAGLTISEKLRRQVRGLDQGARNTQDGISLLQVADGALSEVHDILHRMNELAVKSANGTNTFEDRKSIQEEVDALLKEVDRIGETTSFNEEIIFSGKKSVIPIEGDEYVPLNVGGNNVGVTNKGNGLYIVDVKNKVCQGDSFDDAKISFNGNEYSYGIYSYQTLVNKYLESPTLTWDFELYNKSENGEYIYEKTLRLRKDSFVGERVKGVYEYNKLTDPDYINDYWLPDHKISDDFFNIGGQENKYLKKEDYLPRTIIWDEDGDGVDDNHPERVSLEEFGKIVANTLIDLNSADGVDTPKVTDINHRILTSYTSLPPTDIINTKVEIQMPKEKIGENTNYSDKEYWIQTGVEKEDGLTIGIPAMNNTQLEIDGINVSTAEGAKEAITKVKRAIEKVSNIRSNLGAQQNRLEHTYKNVTNIAENTQAAESRIRDTDMAKEMVELSKQNILEQVGTSMISQANQSNQGVLNLLQ